MRGAMCGEELSKDDAATATAIPLRFLRPRATPPRAQVLHAGGPGARARAFHGGPRLKRSPLPRGPSGPGPDAHHECSHLIPTAPQGRGASAHGQGGPLPRRANGRLGRCSRRLLWTSVWRRLCHHATTMPRYERNAWATGCVMGAEDIHAAGDLIALGAFDTPIGGRGLLRNTFPSEQPRPRRSPPIRLLQAHARAVGRGRHLLGNETDTAELARPEEELERSLRPAPNPMPRKRDGLRAGV